MPPACRRVPPPRAPHPRRAAPRHCTRTPPPPTTLHCTVLRALTLTLTRCSWREASRRVSVAAVCARDGVAVGSNLVGGAAVVHRQFTWPCKVHRRLCSRGPVRCALCRVASVSCVCVCQSVREIGASIYLFLGTAGLREVRCDEFWNCLTAKPKKYTKHMTHTPRCRWHATPVPADATDPCRRWPVL